ncbi:hypothetical protein [uncultured Prochlorococcus sp.]|uniref:hypothetical protein n=1 Tax=uncultured Prochlorococcus sp. TaxID=159733 RepID=UPI00258643D8|nr:hypothetical protein [uncultured Prochlorococcus sp.]
MKRLLLPLLAALALPTAVNSETWFLLGRSNTGATWKVTMGSNEECENQGKEFIKYKNLEGMEGLMSDYVCIQGN